MILSFFFFVYIFLLLFYLFFFIIAPREQSHTYWDKVLEHAARHRRGNGYQRNTTFYF